MGRLTWGDVGKVMVGVVFAVALVPVAASGAGQLVTLVDNDTPSKAQIDGGRLRIGDGDGHVTVDGTLTDSRRGQTPWHGQAFPEAATGSDRALGDKVFVVPRGKRLVVTHVSALFTVPSAAGIEQLEIVVTDVAGSATTNYFSPFGYDSFTQSGTERYFSYDADVEIIIDPGDSIGIGGTTTPTDGVKTLDATFHGYLVNI